MSFDGDEPGRLFAASDLHVSHPENRAFIEAVRPTTPHDWLIVAGDVAESPTDVAWALALLADRFEKVLWVPGNHELWSRPDDPEHLRGEQRYQRLVSMCRELGVLTPEDPYPTWTGEGGPAVVAPLFLLYDYTWRPRGARTKEESLAIAYQAGVVCADEVHLRHEPYPSREAWCQARVEYSLRRLNRCDPDLPTVLVNHFPLVRDPTAVLRYPEFAQWCGTENTSDWHRRFKAKVVVYGHLHIPRTTWYDGVRFEEVSLGYPREWGARSAAPRLRQVLPGA
jgi:3',5'-cyclic AMP phosphodiesterase CpdA